MEKCSYCGSIYNKHYETCPACGANSFISEITEEGLMMDTPPQDGYHLKLEDLRYLGNDTQIITWLGIILVILGPLINIPVMIIIKSNGGVSDTPISYIVFTFFMLILILIGTGVVIYDNNRRNIRKIKLEKLKALSKKGRLIKNLPYEIVSSSYEGAFNLRVNYFDPEGKLHTLESLPKTGLDPEEITDKRVDLLVDPNDYTNYYIDFEIR